MTTTTLVPDQITTLKESLQHDDPAVRFNAGLDLVKQGDEAGIPALIEAFEQKQSTVRLFYAGNALAEMGAPAVPALTAALATSNRQVQVAAAFTLYQIDSTRLDDLLPIAIAALQEDDREAFSDAIQFLGAVGATARPAAPVLLDILLRPYDVEDPENWGSDKRVAAAVLLTRLGQPHDEIVNALIEALQYEVDAVRWGAACALAELGEAASAAIPTLKAVVRDETEVETVRVEAAYALAGIGDPETDTVPTLCAICQSHDWWMRAFAARILGELGSPPDPLPEIENFDWLIQALMGMRDIKRVADARPLARPLADLVTDANYNVRRNAVYALSHLGEQAVEALPALVTALAAEDIGSHAAEALAKIGPIALPALTKSLDVDSELERRHAAYALRLIDTTEAKNAIAGAEQARPLTHITYSPKRFYLQVDVTLGESKIDAFEALYQATLARGVGLEVDYDLPYPKYEFLRYLVEYKGLLMHGSDKLDIDVLKPLRIGVDSADHGNISGVYADMDPIRPIYFAVVHGGRCFGNQNGFFEILANGETSSKGDNTFDERYYKLAVGVNGLRRNFWEPGMMYILPPDSFEFWNEWTSRSPVQPLMRLAVEPADLPLREEVWGATWRNFGDNWVGPEDKYPYLKDVKAHPILPSGKPVWL